MHNHEGDAFQIFDFCPRFEQFGRMHRPISVFRIVRPVAGSPSITVACNPVNGWSKEPSPRTRGNSHIDWKSGQDNLRLTTNMSLTYLWESKPFQLQESLHFALTWNGPLEEDLTEVAERFLQRTRDYWRTWVKHCTIPTLFQKETIRSALALKLHCYEDTGAILAAMTTSLPEQVGHTRNWDYRFCWLRDAYFVLTAFRSLGHFEEIEGFLKFFLNIAHHPHHTPHRLAPVYTLDQELPLPESTHANWNGFVQSSPVRSNNQAAEHVQNDVYGEMILTLSTIFLDHRFCHLRAKDHESLLASLTRNCAETISQPDAGLWEFRSGWREHTFSNLMAWAGLERVEHMQNLGSLPKFNVDVNAERQRAEAAVRRAIKSNTLRNSPADDNVDASLSLLPILHFPDQELSARTVDQIREHLALPAPHNAFFYRYNRNDDFGRPDSAFMICSFWIAQALAHLGQREEAQALLKRSLLGANSLGLYSEHFKPETAQQLGNFPQAYSHVGLINAAFAVSPSWREMF